MPNDTKSSVLLLFFTCCRSPLIPLEGSVSLLVSLETTCGFQSESCNVKEFIKSERKCNITVKSLSD